MQPLLDKYALQSGLAQGLCMTWYQLVDKVAVFVINSE